MCNDPKIFQYIKKFTKLDVLPTQLHDDSDLADIDFTKAELFNKYFFSVFTKSNRPEHQLGSGYERLVITFVKMDKMYQ